MSKGRVETPALTFAQAVVAAERVVQQHRAFVQLHEVLVAAANAEAVRDELLRAVEAARGEAGKARAEAAACDERLVAKRREVDGAVSEVEAFGARRAEEARLRADAEVESQQQRVLAAIQTADEIVAHNEARAAAALKAAEDAERRAGVVREELERLRQRLGA